MSYQGSLEDEIRTAAAEAVRDAETAESYRAMVTQGETDARSAGATRNPAVVRDHDGNICRGECGRSVLPHEHDGTKIHARNLRCCQGEN